MSDAALSIFSAGRDAFQKMELAFPDERFPNTVSSLTNEQCLAGARAFWHHTTSQGFRGSLDTD